jgi:hypothetical protein
MGFKRRKEKKTFLLSFFCVCFSPTFPTTDRLRSALHFGPCEYHIKVTGFEHMVLYTQNRCADQTALHLIPPPGNMWIYPIKKDSNCSRPPRFEHREARTTAFRKSAYNSRLISLAFSFVQSRSESGIEPLTPFGFRFQWAKKRISSPPPAACQNI